MSKDYLDLLGEIDKWCSGENQVDDGEDAEDALRYIRDAIRAFLSQENSPEPMQWIIARIKQEKQDRGLSACEKEIMAIAESTIKK